MKLLSKTEAQKSIKQDNETLIESNLRLRKYEKAVIDRLNSAKDNYEPEKMKAMEDFDRFCKEIDEKKSKKLQELNVIEQEIEKKKEIYYGLIAKQDALDERIHQANEKEKRLDLREQFISGLEKKQNAYIHG